MFSSIFPFGVPTGLVLFGDVSNQPSVRWEMDDGSVLGFGASITTFFRTPGLFNVSEQTVLYSYAALNCFDSFRSAESGCYWGVKRESFHCPRINFVAVNTDRPRIEF